MNVCRLKVGMVEEADLERGTRRNGTGLEDRVGVGAWQTRERIAGSSLRVNVFRGYHSNGDAKR